jgi:hypothetical protein
VFTIAHVRLIAFTFAAAAPLALAACGPAVCPAIAIDCAEGFVPADSDGDGCDDSCEPDVNCEAYPSCNEGDMEVGSSTECLQDDAVCYERELCGTTIWCTGPGYTQCMVEDDCADGESCNTTDYCDAPIDNPNALVACTGRCEALDNCLAVPVCDEGDSEVGSESECLQDDAVCYEREMCGVSIWCTGPA